MSIPDVIHLQFLVLTILLDGEQTGRWVREQLAEKGAPKTQGSLRAGAIRKS